ncbi:MAG: hypothetical protein AAF602_28595, partial [Myxococcota bacterium]
ATMSASSGGQTLTDWFYDPVRHALVFPNGTFASGPVVLEYVDDCGGTLGACSDGIDNDNDGRVDFPDEPGCASPGDSNEADPPEAPACLDGVDDDGDGAIDWPDDPECDAASDDDEDCFELAVDDGGYTMCEIAGASPACPDLSAGPRLPLGGNGAVSVPLGFTLDFYGTDYTDVAVGANGTLTFGAVTSPLANVCLPNAPLGDAVLVWWDDLDPQRGDVWATTHGVAPARSFVVQWRAPHRNGTTDVDVRAVIHETTGDIEVCYVTTAAGPGLANGFSATAGLQHGTTSFLEYSCNQGNLVEDLTVRFEHP